MIAIITNVMQFAKILFLITHSKIMFIELYISPGCLDNAGSRKESKKYNNIIPACFETKGMMSELK